MDKLGLAVYHPPRARVNNMPDKERDKHDHDAHDHHDNGHDEHSGHDHDDDHSRHDHEDRAGHGHDDQGHDDHSGHDHHDHGHGGHDHAAELRGASKRSLAFSLSLISSYMVAEIVGGILSGSLALLADAGHMATDALAIVMALTAMWLGERAASATRTFGYYRTEILAALANVIGLWLIVAWICLEAYHRFHEISVGHLDIEGPLVLYVGLGGLAVNIAAAFLLHRASGHSLNVEGAFQHVLADLLGSVGVVISAALIMAFDWTIADPIISIVIALLILNGTRGLIGRIVNVLLEGTPEDLDVYKLCSDIEDVPGVTFIHDVHVWTITSGMVAFTAHVLINPNYPGDRDELLRSIKDLAHKNFGITHATIQAEESVLGCQEDHHVDHLASRAHRSGSGKRWWLPI